MMFCGKQRGLHLEKVACLRSVLEINLCKHFALSISVNSLTLRRSGQIYGSFYTWLSLVASSVLVKIKVSDGHKRLLKQNKQTNAMLRIFER